MASTYWIKLYHEILEDPKMCKLPDRLYRRVIELFLLAGETDQDGYLPSLSDMSWRLRQDEEQLETELNELQKTGIISHVNGEWIVTNFAKRQARVEGKDRVKQCRERKKKQEYYGDETEVKRNCNDDVTNRYTDIDIDIDKDSDKDKKSPNGEPPKKPKSKPDISGKTKPQKVEVEQSNSLYPLMQALAEVTGMDLKLNMGQISKQAKTFHAAGYTHEDINTFRSWWYEKHWIGRQKGEAPTLTQIKTEIGKMNQPQFVPQPDYSRWKSGAEGIEQYE